MTMVMLWMMMMMMVLAIALICFDPRGSLCFRISLTFCVLKKNGTDFDFLSMFEEFSGDRDNIPSRVALIGRLPRNLTLFKINSSESVF